MKKRLTLVIVMSIVPAIPAKAHAPSKVRSTAFCLHGRMADGTLVRQGSVASNEYKLGTKLTIRKSPSGRRHFVVRDRIGYGSRLDIWTPSCTAAVRWGRRMVSVRIGWH